MSNLTERTFLSKGEHDENVVLRLYMPVVDGYDYSCTLTIQGGRFNLKKTHFWVDGVQATILSMQMAEADLSNSEAFKKGMLYWLDMTDLGLPPV